MSRLASLRALERPMLVAASVAALAGCAFQRLAAELDLMDRAYAVVGVIGNAAEYDAPVVVASVERTADGRVTSIDLARTGPLGSFGFVVERRDGHYLAAFHDADRDGAYDPGEPAWIHADAAGTPAAVAFRRGSRVTRVGGMLAPDVVIPPDMVAAADDLRGDRTLDDVVRGGSIPIALGEVVDLDEPRFSATQGDRGYWEPASFPIQHGVGIFFLEEYDPDRIPVLVVYGARGCPQHWRAFFERLRGTRYQPWFFFYPTGRRLAETGAWLDRGLARLHEHYQFERFHVVGHSMGGLVARAFLLAHVRTRETPQVGAFVSISTPWGGHAAARAGVRQAPVVIPSWVDLAPGSRFLDGLFAEPLADRIEHHLLFGYRGSGAIMVPTSNDGVVGVASQLTPAAQADAAGVYGFDQTHGGMLSDPAVLDRVVRILDEASSRAPAAVPLETAAAR